MELFEHQASYLVKSSQVRGHGLWWEMGTAKSRAIIENLKELYEAGEVRGVFITAAASIYLNWLRQFSEWWPEAQPVVYMSSNPRRSQKEIQIGLSRDGPKILLLNAEALSQERSTAVHVAASFFKELKNELMFVVDESNIIGNPKSARSKVIRKLGLSAKYRRCLSGTPGVETPLKLWAQLEFLEPRSTGMTYWQFQQYVGITKTVYAGQRSFQKIVGYRRIEWVKSLMEKYGSFVAKKECMDLPPKLYETWFVELDDDHRKKYDELLKLGISELSSGRVLPNNAMDKLYQLHNMATGFARTDFGTEWFSKGRVNALMNLLESINGKAIIYTPSRVELQMLDDVLSHSYGSTSLARFHGGIDVPTRNREVDRFQTEESCRWFLANQTAAGFGLTLTAASYVIYFRNAYSLDIRVQSEDRPHRPGQHNPVTIIDIVARNTVDEDVVQAHRDKKYIASQILPFLTQILKNG
jgi:SNF2 family DNA or RNA helicase